MTTIRIAYVGAGMAGKRTALASVLRAANAGDSVEGGTSYDFTWPAGSGRAVSAFVSAARAHAWYEPGTVPTDPRARLEVDQLQLADGVVFVWDAQSERTAANRQELEKLFADLGSKKPSIFCLVNKCDLPNRISPQQLVEELRGIGSIEAVAREGRGCDLALTRVLELAGTNSSIP